MRQGFILGIGTNMDPERNARHIVERLVDRFGRTLVSRFHYTEPVGMDSALNWSRSGEDGQRRGDLPVQP